MITLYFQQGNILLYNVEDWIVLRKVHRIIGDIIGNSLHIPSLPVKISPEEAIFLCDKGIVEVREIIKYEYKNSQIDKFETQMLEYQIADYKKTRKIQLENVIDMIMEQRRKNNDNRSKEEILKEELEKSSPVTKENMIWPILLCEDVQESNTRLVSTDIIQNLTTRIRIKTFQDLHSKGYYLTDGAKFSGDFLVYFGDPICYHAIFIVKCVKHDQKISTMEIVTFGRLGTSVKKRAVLASLVDDVICYLTINWIDA